MSFYAWIGYTHVMPPSIVVLGLFIFSFQTNQILELKGRLCVPDVGELRQHILAEAYNSRYSIHPGATKMYRDLLEAYWWNDIMRDIADFVSKCPNCQQVKVDNQKPGGMTQ